MPNIDLSILNQRQTPAFYADVFANRPAAGFVGRIFVSTNTFAFYRDNGTGWDLIGGPGTGTITGTGTANTFTIFTGASTIGNSSYLTQAANEINVASANINLPANNTFGGTNYYIGQTMADTDYWRIYGNVQGATDSGELVFEIGDNAGSSALDRFRFTINDGALPTDKDLLTLDFDESNLNTNLYVSSGNSVGIGTNVPGAVLDVHSGANIIQQLNQTVATNNSLLAFQNNNAGLWRVGNFYNAGANDFGVFDVIGNIEPFRIKKTTGQVLIGTSTVGSGKLVVASSTGDNGVQIVGASAPSLRIDNAESGPTKRAGLGISTATNNFIQGSADRDFCMFNGSTTASPILFGIYDASTVNVQEAARISPARNFIIGSTVDSGDKFQVASGSVKIVTTPFSPTGRGFFGTSSNHPLGIIANGGEKLTIDTNGNVGINTTNPINGKLDVRGDSGSFSGYFLGNATSSNSFGLGISAGTNGTDFPLLIRNQTESSTYLKVTGNGNTLLGTATDNGNKLQVAGGASVTGVITQNGIYTRSKTQNGTANASNVIFSISYGFPGAISGTVKVFAMAGIIGGGYMSTCVLTFNFAGGNNAGGTVESSNVSNSVLGTIASANPAFTAITALTASITSASAVGFSISLSNTIVGTQITDPTYYIEVSYGLHGNASIS